MKDNLKVRLCEPQDEEAYVRMNLAFMQEVRQDHAYWESIKFPTEEDLGKVFREAVSLPEKIKIFMIEYEGQIVGYANTWSIYSVWMMGRTLTIDDLFIHEAHRHKGLGKKVVKAIIEYAKNHGMKRVQLLAEKDNDVANHVYRKCGFSDQEMLFFMNILNE
ncbi:GNAT family N-acetyltransferase [Clostridiaceae bacterium 35-E11]